MKRNTKLNLWKDPEGYNGWVYNAIRPWKNHSSISPNDPNDENILDVLNYIWNKKKHIIPTNQYIYRNIKLKNDNKFRLNVPNNSLGYTSWTLNKEYRHYPNKKKTNKVYRLRAKMTNRVKMAFINFDPSKKYHYEQEVFVAPHRLRLINTTKDNMGQPVFNVEILPRI